MKKVFKKPRITTKRLNTRVHFYKYTENNGPEAGEKEEKLLYICWASIDGVWLRELEQAISNGTQNDIKLYIRDPQGDYLPSEEHYLEIESRYFKNRLNIKQVSPDLDNKDFIMIRGGYSS
ncbi:TPA: head-tail adaptor protein [Staphylococcus aureus]|nr:head-tail adaptor protein [Staphylococcus aureus]HDP2666201.1 head-tail adaptor protein [Staphylococcus aureus]HDP2739307.1 head-tail adaptor protein [Staphylococcus aureus]HDP3106621.1 head-tail adaptor protein [Staphylococcus aureus]